MCSKLYALFVALGRDADDSHRCEPAVFWPRYSQRGLVFVKIVIRWQPIALVGIVLLALALRLYGIDWDLGNGFHPDERQILFHVSALAWPQSFAQFLNPATSPLNPQF